MMNKLKMLIVDDEPQILESLHQLFDNDFIVITAKNGEDALNCALQNPDLAVVISDQRMPTMKGVDLLKQIKQILPDTMRILLTGYTDLDAVLDSVNLGEIFRYVRKPWQPETLKSIVSLAAASFVLRKQKLNQNMLREQNKATLTKEPVVPTASKSGEMLMQPNNKPSQRECAPPNAEQTELEKIVQNDAHAESVDKSKTQQSAQPSSNQTEESKKQYASFEEEFFATFKPETIAEVEKYQSFEEEFFAKLNEHIALLESTLGESENEKNETDNVTMPTVSLMNEELEDLRNFREVFYGRSGKPKVLVVDDEKRVLTALTDLLSDEFNVIACNDARTALDVLESNALISVLLSDQRMPGMSGVDFLIAAHRIAPLVPKILMTGYTDLEDIVRLVNEGQIFRHIQKPWDVSKLRESLLIAVEEFRHRVEHGLRQRQLYLKQPKSQRTEPAQTDTRTRQGRHSEYEIESLKKIAALLKRGRTESENT
ncbi:MAG: response regulator [Candidatus Thermochlorobacter sp.]